jgi:hypothetical protein
MKKLIGLKDIIRGDREHYFLKSSKHRQIHPKKPRPKSTGVVCNIARPGSNFGGQDRQSTKAAVGAHKFFHLELPRNALKWFELP